MSAGEIRESKTRTNLTIEKDFKTQLQEEAKKKNMSFNAYMIKALETYYKITTDDNL